MPTTPQTEAPNTRSVDTEVRHTKRPARSAAERLRIVEEYDSYPAGSPERGALLRREGVYSFPSALYEANRRRLPRRARCGSTRLLPLRQRAFLWRQTQPRICRCWVVCPGGTAKRPWTGPQSAATLGQVRRTSRSQRQSTHLDLRAGLFQGY